MNVIQNRTQASKSHSPNVVQLKPTLCSASLVKPLRLGVWIDSLTIPIWMSEMLETIEREGHAITSLILVDAEPPETTLTTRPNSTFERLLCKTADTFLQKVIDRGHSGEPASTPVNIAKQFPTTQKIFIEPDPNNRNAPDTESATRTLGSLGLDVILHLATRDPDPSLLQCTRYGTWSLHFSDSKLNRGGPPGYWETMQGWPEIGSELRLHQVDSGQTKVLVRSTSPVYQHEFTKTRDRLYWKTQSFIPRALKQLQAGGQAYYDAISAEPDMKHDALINDLPTPYEHFRMSASRTVSRSWACVRNRYFRQQWGLMFQIANTGYETAPIPSSSELASFKKIVPPQDRIWADPHVVERDSKYYIFIEECLHDVEKGFISVIEMDKKGDYKQPVPILDRPYHLSYPFIFEHQNEFYLIPESGEHENIELHRCTRFPDQWEFVMNLMESEEAADTTLYFHEGLWWLFVNMPAHRNVPKWDELHLFYAKDFRTSDWTPHPANPIVSDVKSARPAGKLFSHRDKLYRPSQNCSYHYGYGMNVSEITTLNTEEYAEKITHQIKPDWDDKIIGTHTISKAGNLTVIDALFEFKR